MKAGKTRVFLRRPRIASARTHAQEGIPCNLEIPRVPPRPSWSLRHGVPGYQAATRLAHG